MPGAKPDGLRERVAIAAGSGMTVEEIGAALGLSVERLQTRYARALVRGAYEKRLEAVVALYRRAANGDVAAVRLYLRGSLPPDVCPLPGTVGLPVPVPDPAILGPTGVPEPTNVPGPVVPTAPDAAAPTVDLAALQDRRGRRPPEGWKEAANRAAETAHVGTPWSGVLPDHKTRQ